VQERTAVTILQVQKRDSWSRASYARNRHNGKGKIRGQQMFDTVRERKLILWLLKWRDPL